MQHPFTCIVAGCTQSGKTVLVKSLLNNAQKTISPPLQRIIWCYGQWQPSYFDMMRTMPGIEFNQGIPEDICIDNADYLDVSQRNLIALDDLMTQSSKDKRIAELFTKGSHHRNLSIIYIVQNIFHQGKETRNISLNAHYIVLFKSPSESWRGK
jgi:GTPase SAR1 family protein